MIYLDTWYNADKEPKPWHCDLTMYNPRSMKFETIMHTEQHAHAKEAKSQAHQLASTSNYTIKEE